MKDITKKLEELFNSMTDVSSEKMEKVVQEFTKVFEELVSKMTSKDETERTEAIEAANNLREVLEKQAQVAFDATRMDAEGLQNYVQNPNNFNDEEWRALQQATKELQTYQKELSVKGILGQAKKVPKKGPKKEVWLNS